MTFDLHQALSEPTLVYLHNNEAGSLRVMENQHYRWLQINDTVHTLMSLDTPERFVLPHLHAMAMGLFLSPGRVRHVLELGLGGGAMSRFLHGTYACQVTSIEFDSDIIHCFEQFFNPEGYDFTIIRGDAEREVTQFNQQDLVIVDLYGGESSPDFLTQKHFYQHCFNALTSEGVLLLNLLPGSELFLGEVESILIELSGHRPVCLSVPGYKNRILIASQQPLPRLDYTPELEAFCQRYHIDLNTIVLL